MHAPNLTCNKSDQRLLLRKTLVFGNLAYAFVTQQHTCFEPNQTSSAAGPVSLSSLQRNFGSNEICMLWRIVGSRTFVERKPMFMKKIWPIRQKCRRRNFRQLLHRLTRNRTQSLDTRLCRPMLYCFASPKLKLTAACSLMFSLPSEHATASQWANP